MIGYLARLRFDPTVFALMLGFCAVSIVSSLVVSYTSLRYVFEAIGGMPWDVASAAPLTVDATIGAGVMAEWWLIGRRHEQWWPFVLSLTVGLLFALITIAGNAAHGALALTVQQPLVLQLGGTVAYMPWWLPIAASAVPGLALFASSYMTTLVIGAWRRERAIRREPATIEEQGQTPAAAPETRPVARARHVPPPVASSNGHAPVVVAKATGEVCEICGKDPCTDPKRHGATLRKRRQRARRQEAVTA